MELLFHELICGAFEPFVDEIDLAMIALCCDFALDLFCNKRCARFCMTLHRAPLPVESCYYGMAPLPPLSINVLKIMKGAVRSVCHRQRMRFNYCWPSYKSRIASAMVCFSGWDNAVS